MNGCASHSVRLGSMVPVLSVPERPALYLSRASSDMGGALMEAREAIDARAVLEPQATVDPTGAGLTCNENQKGKISMAQGTTRQVVIPGVEQQLLMLAEEVTPQRVSVVICRLIPFVTGC